MDSNKAAPPPYDGQQPPPQPVYFAPQPVPVATVSAVTVVPTGIAVATITPMGTEPQSTVCKNCNQQIYSQVRHKATTKTHLIALVLCLVGCWPCVCIPYCTNSCRNIDHYCPNCDAYIGSYVG